MDDPWNLQQYERFAEARRAPFLDLLALIEPIPGGEAVDMGCGSGALTRLLHQRSGAAITTGVDTSPAMLAQAATHADAAVRFVRGDLTAPLACDLLVSNAALHWVPDHPRVLATWRAALRPGGQLAVQVPANGDHPAHRLVDEVAREAPFAAAFPGGEPPPDPVLGVLSPRGYAELLDDLGFVRQHVRAQVYGLHVASGLDVLEWLKGSTLNRLRGPLEAAGLYDAYLVRLGAALRQRLAAPYFYAFQRVLLRGRLAP